MKNDRRDDEAEYRRTKRKLIGVWIFAIVFLALLLVLIHELLTFDMS